MLSHIVSGAANGQLFSWLQYTLTCGHKELERRCLNHLKWNFAAIANTPDFGNCDINLLSSVLTHDDIVVHDEMTLYK